MSVLARVRTVYVIQLASGLFLDWDCIAVRSLAKAGRAPDWDNAYETVTQQYPGESFEIHRIIELDE